MAVFLVYSSDPQRWGLTVIGLWEIYGHIYNMNKYPSAAMEAAATVGHPLYSMNVCPFVL